MDEFLLILGMVVVTFSVRYGVLAASQQIQLSPPLFRLLRYVPVAVLAAIVAPAVLIPAGSDSVWISPANTRFLGAVAAVLVGWWSRNLVFTIGVGMAVFLVGQWLL